MGLFTNKQEQIKKNIESYLTSLDLSFDFAGFSDTNGTSFYYSVSLKGSDIVRKVRFSDHGISNFERMFSEVCFNIYRDFNERTGTLLGELGHADYKWQPVMFKAFNIEVQQLKEGQKAISERLTKSGNTLYTIQINKPLKWAWVKK